MATIDRWRPYVTAAERWGVLEIRLPKVDEVKPKEIKIDLV